MLDGRSFSKLIKNRFKQPFDPAFHDIMNKTTIHLCKNIQGALIAYTQSDEISIVLAPDSEFWDRRLCKMQSIIAGMAASYFNKEYILSVIKQDSDLHYIEEKFLDATFDCKCWTVPSLNDAYAWLQYRQNDCVRNSKCQAAQTYFNHKELQNLTADEQIRKLKDEYGIDWNEFRFGEKYGRYVKKDMITTVIPWKNERIQRSVWNVYSCEPFINIKDRILHILTSHERQ